jgi:hypothetical protein
VKAGPPDVEWFSHLAEMAGRSHSVVFIGPGHGLGCNVLRLEMEAAASTGGVGDLAANVASLISTVVRIGGGEDSSFQSIWPAAGEDSIRHASTAVYLARGDLLLDEICEVMSSAPQSITQVSDPVWQRESTCAKILALAAKRDPGNRNLFLAHDYWLRQFPTFPPDTRNSILFTVNAGGLNLLRRDPLYSMFFNRTDYSPGILRDGAIIICDCPVLQYKETGRLANCLFRLMVQRWLGRKGRTETARPAGIIYDESQKTLSPEDIDFQETARATRTATVAATLSLPTLIDKVGEDRALSFLNYLRTQTFFQSADETTGQYMASRCGKIVETKETVTRGHDGKKSVTKSEEEIDALPAYAANNLKTGDKANGFIVEGFVTNGGKTLLGGLPYVKARFDQKRFRTWWPGRVSVVARRRPAPDFRYLRRKG